VSPELKQTCIDFLEQSLAALAPHGSINQQSAQIEHIFKEARRLLPQGRSAARRKHGWYEKLKLEHARISTAANRIVAERDNNVDPDAIQAAVDILLPQISAFKQRLQHESQRGIPNVAEANKNPAAAHRVIDRALNPPLFSATIKEGGEEWKSDRQKAAGLARIFAEKQKFRPGAVVPETRFPDRPHGRGGASVPPVTITELTAAIAGNSDGKAADFDGIDAELLKLLSQEGPLASLNSSQPSFAKALCLRAGRLLL
jgi:hypothetical protein